MFTDREKERYERHFSLSGFGMEGQTALRNGSALCVGAGGLGSPAALYLAAAGIGRLGIVDDDTVDLSNLQRQILHDERTIGTPKVQSASQRLTSASHSTTQCLSEPHTVPHSEHLFSIFRVYFGHSTRMVRLVSADSAAGD